MSKDATRLLSLKFDVAELAWRSLPNEKTVSLRLLHRFSLFPCLFFSVSFCYFHLFRFSCFLCISKCFASSDFSRYRFEVLKTLPTALQTPRCKLKHQGTAPWRRTLLGAPGRTTRSKRMLLGTRASLLGAKNSTLVEC